MTNGTDSGPRLNPTAGTVAVILAVGLAVALNLITAGVLYDAIFSKGPGLSSNATQILTAAFGGIIGVLGSYVGYRAASSQWGASTTTTPAPPVEPPTTTTAEPTPWPPTTEG